MPRIEPLDTRASLLIRIRNPRDGASWQSFTEVYAPLVYQYGRRKGLQDADAADLSQDVLTEVARCIRSFEYTPGRGRFRDWLGTLTFRRLGHFFERRKRILEVVPDESGSVVADCAESTGIDPEWTDEFNSRILHQALERTRPHYEPTTWRAFELSWVQNRPAPEVAAELNVPVVAIYVAKSRVLKRLEDEVRLLADDVPCLIPLH